jgi:hypothetical protein
VRQLRKKCAAPAEGPTQGTAQRQDARRTSTLALISPPCGVSPEDSYAASRYPQPTRRALAEGRSGSVVSPPRIDFVARGRANRSRNSSNCRPRDYESCEPRATLTDFRLPRFGPRHLWPTESTLFDTISCHEPCHAERPRAGALVPDRGGGKAQTHSWITACRRPRCIGSACRGQVKRLRGYVPTGLAECAHAARSLRSHTAGGRSLMAKSWYLVEICRCRASSAWSLKSSRRFI